MEPPHRPGDGTIELEVVQEDGRPVVSCPIDVHELLARQGRTVRVGDGVQVRLERYNSSESYTDEEESEEEEEDESDGSRSSSERGKYVDAPPAYRGWTGHEDDAHHNQHEKENVHAKRLGLKISEIRHESADGHRGITNSSSNKNNKKSLSSRQDIWSSFSPPTDPDRNYKYLHSTSLMPSARSRRFKLPPLMFHAVSSFLDPHDQGQRILVYGGTTNVGKTVEKELYEFSLLTGHWRRIEGKQGFFPGNYAHATVVIEKLHRLVVIGGVSPGGREPVGMNTYSDDLFKLRSRLLFPYKDNAKTKNSSWPMQAETMRSDKPTLWSLAIRADGEPSPGFMSILFDMNLKTHRWRAVQTSSEIPVVFHTAVVAKGTIYVFGGLTNRLQVSSQLIGINSQTYAISVISSSSSGTSPQARYLHSAVIYGNWIIVYGGFDVHNEPLNDTWAFDLINEKWEKLECHGAPSRAAHASCIVGSRLLTIGGFEDSIAGGGKPTNSVFELQLIPTVSSQYLWRELKVHPAVPPVAFSVACHCADDASFILYGGCTLAGKNMTKQRPNAKQMDHHSPSHDKDHKSNKKRNGNGSDDDNDDDDDDNNDFWRGLVPFNDGFVFTFPLKKSKDKESDASMHVNESRVMTDPEELSPEFKAFVKRQQDFIRKKNAAIMATMKKTTLDELEDMEPQLYLSDEEVELLLNKSNELYESFTVYKMDMLPNNVPDREMRLYLNEECISLSRQIRDVLSSMKGSEPGITAVKSKTHRIKSGQKFEDHSAAKPFRRVIVTSLVKEMRKHMKQVHLLNKALRTVEWDDKKNYTDAVDAIREQIKTFVQTVKDVLEKYIERRVSSLVSSVDKRKDNLRRLAEIVEKNRHDKIFQKEEPDSERERVKRMWNKGEGKATPQKDPKRSISHSSHNYSRYRSTGAGYYKDEENAVIALQPKEVEKIMKMVQLVQKSSGLFEDYCKSTMSSVEKAPNGISPSDHAPPPPPPVIIPNSETQFLAVPTPLTGAGMIPPTTTNMHPETHTAEVAAATAGGGGGGAGVGTASHSELVIRHSDSIRQMAIEKAALVRECMCTFEKELKEYPQTVENGPESSSSFSHMNSNRDDKKEMSLRLLSLRPLLSCKRQLAQLKEKIPGIRVNHWAADDVAGAPQDEEAQKRFGKLSKYLCALVQRLTASFLTRAGARPSRSTFNRLQVEKGQKSGTSIKSSSQHHPPLPLQGSSLSSRSSPLPSPLLMKNERRVLKIISTINSSSGATVEEGSDSSLSIHQQQQEAEERQQQQQQQLRQPLSCAFGPLSTPLIFEDAPYTLASTTTTEIPKPISLTSHEAMSLVPTFSTVTPVSTEGVIIPSTKDTKVISNTLPLQSSNWKNDNASATNSLIGTSHPLSSGDAIFQPPAPQIVLSKGPQTTTSILMAPELTPFQESLSAMHMRPGTETEENVPSGMVSLFPGQFNGPSVSSIPVNPGTGVSPFQDTMDLEDDYFLFGRRYEAEPLAAPSAVENTEKHHHGARVTSMDSPLRRSGAHTVKVSPSVGMPGGPIQSVAKKKNVRTLFRHHHHHQKPTSSSSPPPSSSMTAEPVAIQTEPLGRGMFRGKLTPGELQILQARDRLRSASSRR